MNTLPNSLEAEENVIASILVDNSNHKYIDKLEEIDFYNQKNREIFKTIKELHNNDAVIDLLTVKEKGAKKYDGEKLFAELIRITDKLVFASNIEHYIKILKNLSIRRQIYFKATEICKEILGTDSDKDETDIKNEMIQKFIDIKTQNNEANHEMKDVMSQTTANIEKKYRDRDDLRYRTGYFDVDKVTDGLHEQELTIIAARPSVGKTAFALQMAENIAKKRSIYIFRKFRNEWRTARKQNNSERRRNRRA